MAELIRIEALSAGYDETVVVDGVSLALAPGRALAVLGRNGVGKSTLMAAIMGLAARRAGRIGFDDIDIAAWPTHRRAQAGLGYVPQEREIFGPLTVEENLAVGARPGAWTLERIYALFPALAERRQTHGDRLSGGEQQMLALARALMGNPKLLLLDEPFEGLAPVIVDLLVDVLVRIRSAGLAMLLVEHNVELALALTDTALVMDRGRIVWEGASAALAADPARLAALIGLEPVTG
jgi:branched-chain amino acid transport system ATP-binding protein